MITILLISNEVDALAGLESGLRQYSEIEILRADSSQDAIDTIAEKEIDLVVVDENLTGVPGTELTKKLVSANPMANYALVSSLSPKDFHEASEGLGVIMQLPVKPGRNQADTLMDCLKKVLSLTQ